jgi:glutathione S-transferase
MILIGMFDSPFVRRVAVSMNLLKMPFEHRNWSVGKDFEKIQQFNPLARVPTLVPPSGHALMESSAILDYLDDLAGPDRGLIPRSGKERRETLRIMAIATGAAEKGVAQVYETVFRPSEKRHRPWTDRCNTQMRAALAELDRAATASAGSWLVGDRMSQADITATCAYTFLVEAPAADCAASHYPALAAIAARCEALPEFSSVKVEFFPPAEG